LDDFNRALSELRRLGYADDDIAWAEGCKQPAYPSEFAWEVIFVICNSGMKNTVACKIVDRVKQAIRAGRSASTVFGHKGKAAAIDKVWADREVLYRQYFEAVDPIAFLASLPWIGDITKYHLARNFGFDFAKPDVHLQRLANHYQTTPQALCEGLARLTGYRIGTVDTLLWRACAIGVINSRTGEIKA
jgi:hypothetical protein